MGADHAEARCHHRRAELRDGGAGGAHVDAGLGPLVAQQAKDAGLVGGQLVEDAVVGGVRRLLVVHVGGRGQQALAPTPQVLTGVDAGLDGLACRRVGAAVHLEAEQLAGLEPRGVDRLGGQRPDGLALDRGPHDALGRRQRRPPRPRRHAPPDARGQSHQARARGHEVTQQRHRQGLDVRGRGLGVVDVLEVGVMLVHVVITPSGSAAARRRSPARCRGGAASTRPPGWRSAASRRSRRAAARASARPAGCRCARSAAR